MNLQQAFSLKQLHAGNITVYYQHGFLRHAMWGDDEIVRMIYFALRDENWYTLDLMLSDEEIVSDATSFRIHYNATNRRDGVELIRWAVVIEGSENGRITFDVRGTVVHDVQKNRAGFCVLHPIQESAGEEAVITHTNGAVEKSSFPITIAAANPFEDIKSMRWHSAGHWFTIDVEGDIFETEDQRNWSDASFKTFCTPSHLPMPVLLKKGDVIKQRISFKPDGPLPARTESSTIHLRRSAEKVSWPSIGIGQSMTADALPEHASQLLRALSLSHYRIDLHFSNTHWVTHFSNHCVIASSMHCPIEAVLHLTGDYKNELEMFLSLCHQNRLTVKSALLLSEGEDITRDEIIAYAVRRRSDFRTISIGAGTNYNFTELNKHRFDSRALDFVSYGLHPQEHAFDDITIVENLQAQANTIQSAKQFHQTSIHIGRVTLKKRFNPYASSDDKKNIPYDAQTDPRQKTSFTALWTLGSIKNLTEAGAASITYYQPVGEQGIISETGRAFPVYDALKMILEKKAQVIKSTSTHPLFVDSLCFDDGSALVWNYTAVDIDVHLDGTLITLKPFEIRNMLPD